MQAVGTLHPKGLPEAWALFTKAAVLKGGSQASISNTPFLVRNAKSQAPAPGGGPGEPGDWQADVGEPPQQGQALHRKHSHTASGGQPSGPESFIRPSHPPFPLETEC